MKKRKYSKSAYEDILAAADKLFYEKGYSASNVADILESSGSHKASFYSNFSSKNELAVAYLNRRSKGFIDHIEEIMKEYKDIRDFIHAWVEVLKTQIDTDTFHGCSLANMRAQSLDDKDLAKEIKNHTDRWFGVVRNYILQNIEEGKISREIESELATRKFMIACEGSMQMYQLTGDNSYIWNLEKDLLSCLGI